MEQQDQRDPDEPPITAIAEVLHALRDEILSDHALMVAAGLAYYAAFGLLPAVAGAAAVWAQFGSRAWLQESLHGGGHVVPAEMVAVLKQFITSVPDGFGGGVTLLLNIALVVLTSYRAAGGLLTALSIVYDLSETRSRRPRVAVTLAIGLGGLLLLFIGLGLMILPLLVAAWGQNGLADALFWLRWPALALLFFIGLVLLFRFGPDRTRVHWQTVTAGAAVAMLLWIVASVAVSVYVDHITSFGKLYGSLGTVAVVLLWFYVDSVAVLTGAEIDAVLAARREDRPRRPPEFKRSR